MRFNFTVEIPGGTVSAECQTKSELIEAYELVRSLGQPEGVDPSTLNKRP
jgi:hypothetical protein